MRKFQAVVNFEVDDKFMSKIPKHREVINSLISKGIIDQYAISANLNRGWITFTANTAQEFINQLKKSPLFPYFDIEIDELMVFDGKALRFPAMQLN
jgi:hypothetical protein